MLNVVALLVICLMVVLIALAIVKLGFWPKRAAEARGHPHADAINVLSWGGLVLTAGVGWLVALVWAHAPPREDLETRVRELETQIRALKA